MRGAREEGELRAGQGWSGACVALAIALDTISPVLLSDDHLERGSHRPQ